MKLKVVLCEAACLLFFFSGNCLLYRLLLFLWSASYILVLIELCLGVNEALLLRFYALLLDICSFLENDGHMIWTHSDQIKHSSNICLTLATLRMSFAFDVCWPDEPVFFSNFLINLQKLDSFGVLLCPIIVRDFQTVSMRRSPFL